MRAEGAEKQTSHAGNYTLAGQGAYLRAPGHVVGQDSRRDARTTGRVQAPVRNRPFEIRDVSLTVRKTGHHRAEYRTEVQPSPLIYDGAPSECH